MQTQYLGLGQKPGGESARLLGAHTRCGLWKRSNTAVLGVFPAGVTGILPTEIFDQVTRPAAYMICGSLLWGNLFVVGMAFPFLVVSLASAHRPASAQPPQEQCRARARAFKAQVCVCPIKLSLPLPKPAWV